MAGRGCTVGAALLVGVVLAAGEPGAFVEDAVRAGLPPVLEAHLAKVVRLPLPDERALVAGEPVTMLLDADPGKEVAVFGAVWIAAPAAVYVARVKEIETFERGGGFVKTRRISDPPRLEDFAEMTLPDDDIADLRRCRVGGCKVKLGAQSLRKIQGEIDWKRPTARADAMALFRRLTFDYVTGYREGGNARLAVYRDTDRATVVEREIRRLIEGSPSLQALPDLQRYLLDYPAVSLPGSTDFLYWQETRFGLKPTIRISHLVIDERQDQTVVASKMLYASHYFWAALELRILLPDPSRGDGFWFLMVSRGRSDGLSGFLGRMVRGRARNEARAGTLAALTATKAELESK